MSDHTEAAMDAFKWISVVLSMILGLGVTRLLAATVAVFRSRKKAQLDWVPLAWAGCIFLWQLQYWWAIIELPGMIQYWTIGSFLMLMILPLACIWSRSRRVREAITALYIPLSIWAALGLSRPSY